ncbi:hypothetical protein DES39_1159 [Orbus hercynius]|uniref:Uncharacterized protein n=1 Tax=Orbus hercynius TaxID=593135 RepID=A0A495REX2_9GAMM|nr:hypothetical protein [Orbus hercynius]RKS85746.1 hypothetical protein DES39_1159 [Orbus hercynius]
MRNDNDIYNDIGKILFSISPDGAKKVILQAEFVPEGDVCTFLYDYVDADNNTKWFDNDSAQASSDLMDYLIELREFTIVNNLTNGNSIWIGCIVTVDIEKAKINIDFKYEPFIEE